MYFTKSLYFTFQLNFFRNKHKIHVQGTDLPDPIATFQQLDQEYKINSRLLQNILDAGFQTPTPIQMQAIPVMLHVSVKASKCACVCVCAFILFPLWDPPFCLISPCWNPCHALNSISNTCVSIKFVLITTAWCDLFPLPTLFPLTSSSPCVFFFLQHLSYTLYTMYLH